MSASGVRAKDAANNVALYFDALGIEAAEAETAHLTTILGSSFPDLDGGQVAALIAAAPVGGGRLMG